MNEDATTEVLGGHSEHHTVIVGCGFAGLFAARALKHAPAHVTVIDRTNHHLFQPLLYQMATGILSSGDIAPPIRDILRKQRNTTVLLGEVIALDAERHVVEVRAGLDALGSRSEVPYDSLIVATGSEQSYFGNDQFANDAPGLKTIDDALEVRSRLFGAFEMAEQEEDATARSAWMTFVVVGAGPSGVEMAGQIAELAHRSLRHNFRSIDPMQTRVVLLDGAQELLATFPDSLQRSAIAALEKLGVEIHLGTMVTGVDADGIDTNSSAPELRRIEARTKIWAAGVQASPLGQLVADATGASVDRSGRVHVQDDCTVPDHSEIFIVGDLMSLDDLPGLAEVAMQSGAHAGRTIRRRLAGTSEPKPFTYHDLGTMATVSRFSAVATIGRMRLSGFVGWLAWLLIHLMFLTGFKNRVLTLVNWTIAFIGRGRLERTITIQQAAGPETTQTQDLGG
jgi:NADH:ubiquinone reductase (H+-translocating)